MEQKMILRDSYGWPVELVEGRPVLNFFRRLFVTHWRETWRRRHDGWPKAYVDGCVGCQQEQDSAEAPP